MNATIDTDYIESLGAFVRSLNSIAFEEWYGRYFAGGKFVMFDSDGDSVASGKDALDAWQNFKEQGERDEKSK